MTSGTRVMHLIKGLEHLTCKEKGLEHMTCKERLRKLGLFSCKNRKFARVKDTNLYKYLMVGTE